MDVNLLSLDSLSLIEDSDHVMVDDECDTDAGGNVNVWIKSSLSSVVICEVNLCFSVRGEAQGEGCVVYWRIVPAGV